jgi:citrate synthase
MLNSAIGGGDADHIKVRGYDLVDDLMDQRDFIDVLCLEILGDFPDANLKRMINMFLVTSSDHGLTPSALSTRLTARRVPAGAVAAGILGAGSRFLGTVEYSARFLAGVAADVGADWTAEHMRAAAKRPWHAVAPRASVFQALAIRSTSGAIRAASSC